MKEKTRKLFAFGFIGLTALTVGTSAASAFNGKSFGGQDNSFASDDTIRDSIQNNDFEAFKDAINDNQFLEEKFDIMVSRSEHAQAIQEAIENEDYDSFVNAISEIDREVPSEEQFNRMILENQAHEKIEQAINDENYDLWVSAVEDLQYGNGMADLISEDEFELLIEMYDAKDAGDFKEAKELAEELGLDERMGKNPHFENHEHMHRDRFDSNGRGPILNK